MVFKRLRCRSVRIKLFLLCLLVFVLYFVTSYLLIKEVSTKTEPKKPRKRIPNVVIHLDLKGSPPKLNYLKTLLPTLKDLGATGLLIEYEDMFPYTHKLVNLSAINCYDKSEEFLIYAEKEGFDIIPLVQTFGHMEHVLKLAEFQHLRENSLYPNSICPSHPESRELIHDMLDQVIKFHAEIVALHYFHIGCDEVFLLNECKECLRRSLTNTELFINHVKTVTDIVYKFSPEIVILAWDDMFRKIPMNVWDSIDVKIEPVYWDYRPSLSVSHINLVKYHRKFKNIWIASAFKGADGPIASVPNMLRRFLNNYGWLKFIDEYTFGGETEVYEFSGIILTGWSRYSHMDPPCELLPVAFPSLVLNLILINFCKYHKEPLPSDLNEIFSSHVSPELTVVLKCSNVVTIDLFTDNHCSYDGYELFQILQRNDEIKDDIINTLYNGDSKFLAVKFYSKTNYFNMADVKFYIDWSNSTLSKLIDVESDMKKYLANYYDDYFIKEYVNFKMYNEKVIISKVKRTFEYMFKAKSWHRRFYVEPFKRKSTALQVNDTTKKKFLFFL